MTPRADREMTAERNEVKYLVSLPAARKIAAHVHRSLPLHRFAGPGANGWPGARHYVTTVYFDTFDRRLYRAAVHDQRALKIRAKEYYDQHPGLVSVARHPQQSCSASSVLWLELKSTEGARSRKRRIGIPRAHLVAFLCSGVITQEMVDIQHETYGSEADAVLEELARVCRELESPLQPDVIVNYQRTAWQGEGLRITLDRDLTFYRPTPEMLARPLPLVRSELGLEIGRLEECVLEIKSRGELPRFLEDLLEAQSSEPRPFSKFVAASALLRS